jgi:hypothetical protein
LLFLTPEDVGWLGAHATRSKRPERVDVSYSGIAPSVPVVGGRSGDAAERGHGGSSLAAVARGDSDRLG